MQIHKQIEEAMPRLRAEIAGAVARGYCYVENSKKVLDPDLLKAMGKELEMLFKKELSTIATKSAEEERRAIMREAGAVFVNWDESKKE